jgi:cytochrome P450
MSYRIRWHTPGIPTPGHWARLRSSLAFGLGTHTGPGAQPTRIEARAAIPALLRRFPPIRLASAPPVWRRTAALRGLEHLPVRVT